MKRFELMTLTLRNFKGIKDYMLPADGNNLDIKGRNATGKTTLVDSFTWLLFGKDSKNKTDFEIKELDESGKVKQHGLEHEVEGVFRLDGQVFSLKRVLTENWTKKRNHHKKTFTGHTIKYYIDDVPKKKKEFDEKVSSIVSENAFKLLTNPLYFNKHLDYKERRKILMEISGNVTDDEVAENSKNKDLKKFMDELSGKNIEDYKLMIAEKRKKLNSELDIIPIRIDEINLGMEDISGLNEEDLKTDYEIISRKIEQKRQKINDIRNGGEISNQRKLLSDIELDLSNIKNEHRQKNQTGINQLKLDLSESVSNYRNTNNQLQRNMLQIGRNQKQMNVLNIEIDSYREEWVKENRIKFEHTTDCNCPTCGQELPAEQIESANEKALSDFNKSKAEKLERIQRHAENKKSVSQELQDENNNLQEEIDEMNDTLKNLQTKIDSYEKELEVLEANTTDVNDNIQFVEKMTQKKEIIKHIEELETSVDSTVSLFEEKLMEIKAESRTIVDKINKITQAERAKIRIQELEEREQFLSAELEKIDYDIFMMEQFTKEKVEMLEEKISSHFQSARFKMYEEQINGGLKETCQTIYKGVPYDGGLNNASRINVGLDIINTLSRHYGICCPLFIDNAESVTDLIEIDTQLISLTVDKKAEKLMVQDLEQAKKIS